MSQQFYQYVLDAWEYNQDDTSSSRLLAIYDLCCAYYMTNIDPIFHVFFVIDVIFGVQLYARYNRYMGAVGGFCDNLLNMV